MTARFQAGFNWRSNGGGSSDTFDTTGEMYYPATIEIEGSIFSSTQYSPFQWVASQGRTDLFTGSASINSIA